MNQKSQLNREFIIEWNYKFPLDKWWRDKHGVALFSEEHLNANQLNIALEYQENLVFKEFEDRADELSRKREAYSKGIWITKPEPKNGKEFTDLFDKIDVSTINTNNNSNLQFEEEVE